MRRYRLWAPVLLAVVTFVSTGCATNPATGKRQLSFYSTEAEIELGRRNDQQIVQELGLYPDEEVQAWVRELGEEIAAGSERPELPWTFRVVDDPVVNAFALPGGFIYITRGILGHLGSEAELAAVLGHEIGHVTARHGVERLSKAQLAQAGLVAGAIAAPELAYGLGGLAQQGIGLLFLQFSRDDEREADALGFRYMNQAQYPPTSMVEVFNTLERASGAAEGDRLPVWAATHPYPDERRQRTRDRISQSQPGVLYDGPPGRDVYMTRIDGITYGADPRQGFFVGNRFYHPEMDFELEMPAGWTYQNTRQAVVAMSPEKDALVALTLSDEPSPEAASRSFFQEASIRDDGNVQVGYEGIARAFQTQNQQTGQTTLRGVTAWTRWGDNLFQLIGITQPDSWRRAGRTTIDTVASFRRLSKRKYRDVEAMRISIVTLDRAMSLEEFDRRYPSDIDLDRLAVINQTTPEAQLQRGDKIKRVQGFNPEREE
ncbi:MAG: M48 family metalloprotease [Acidobacteriota bacterium]